MGAIKDFFSDVRSWGDNFLTGERDFNRQKELQEIAQQFSANEAQKSRDWQAQLSNTAYQRAAKDLKAAGLNPALLYSSSGQASTPAGATAHGLSASAGSSGQGVVSLITNLISGMGSFMLKAQRQAANAAQYRGQTVVYTDSDGVVRGMSRKTYD